MRSTLVLGDARWCVHVRFAAVAPVSTNVRRVSASFNDSKFFGWFKLYIILHGPHRINRDCLELSRQYKITAVCVGRNSIRVSSDQLEADKSLAQSQRQTCVYSGASVSTPVQPAPEMCDLAANGGEQQHIR